MFTKYNNISVPKNYSGNRFRQVSEDTETKMHRATVANVKPNEAKTSVSPYFQAQLTNSLSLAQEEDDRNTKNEEFLDTVQEDVEEFNDTPADKSVEADISAPISNIAENKLMQLFKNVKNDDLLLLALILLFAKDNTENGTDALVILALLLMYH